jgi:predicted TPR repeat methyltransferase
MHEWSRYWRRGFKVLNTGPSTVVESALEKSEDSSNKNALDLGCGELRNSIFLASNGYSVDAIDIKRPALLLRLNKRIRFKKRDISRLSLPSEKYGLVVCTRVMQYLSPDDLEKILGQISKSLDSKGILCLNYTVDGGLVGRDDSPVKTYSHKVTEVKRFIREQGLRLVQLEELIVETSAHTPDFEARGDHLACDIIAVKD